jgi:hypothetical protein
MVQHLQMKLELAEESLKQKNEYIDMLQTHIRFLSTSAGAHTDAIDHSTSLFNSGPSITPTIGGPIPIPMATSAHDVSLSLSGHSPTIEAPSTSRSGSLQLNASMASSIERLTIDEPIASPSASPVIQSPYRPRSTPPTVGNSGGFIHSSGSPSLPIPTTPPCQSPTHTKEPSLSYAQVAKTKSPALTLLRRPQVTSTPASTLRRTLKDKHKLTTVYFLGLSQSKLGEFRKHAKQIGLSLQSVQNISFVGSSIVELLIESTELQAFADQAKLVGFQVKLDIDITAKDKHNPLWLEHPTGAASFAEKVRLNFIDRVSHEIKSTTKPRVREYYLDWARMLKMEHRLVLDSTSIRSS